VKRRKTAKKSKRVSQSKKPTKKVVSAETRAKLSQSQKFVQRLKRTAKTLVEDGKRSESYPAHDVGLLKIARELRIETNIWVDGRDYAGWRILKRMIDEDHPMWIEYRNIMRELGFSDADIRSEWFSPEL